MRFPSRTRRLFWLLFWLAVGPLILIFPASAWLAWTLQPLRKVYLTTYAASSAGAGIPHGEMTIRWVMKTAPRRKPVPASAENVVAGPDSKLPASLSPKAIAEGWRGVACSAPEKVLADGFAKGLRDYVYDGVSVWWLFGRPCRCWWVVGNSDASRPSGRSQIVTYIADFRRREATEAAMPSSWRQYRLVIQRLAYVPGRCIAAEGFQPAQAWRRRSSRAG